MGDLKLRGSQDNHVYLHCWLKAFKANIFKRFHTIIKTGDNGSALKSYDTFHLHSVLMQEYFVRIIYHTLCPYHAENYCDPAGARTKAAIKKYERKAGEATGDAFNTAVARNMYRKSPKVKEAKGTEAPREYNRYMPEEMIRKKQWWWPYSLGQCCVVFLQLTDIHENAKDPVRTIELGACGFGAPTAKNAFGVIDLRWDTLEVQKTCPRCSTRFQRTVPVKEHNQKGFFLCPKTNVYRRETPESLTRICLHCNQQVKDAHTESPHRSDKCPSEEVRGQVLHRHQSFSVMTIDGWKRYPITSQVKKWTPADVSPQVLADIKSRYKPVKRTEQKQINPKRGSVAAAQMMAPGITVVYQIGSAGRTDRKYALSWGIGVCRTVHEKNTFEIEVFTPSDPAAHQAPWGTWKPTARRKEISFLDTSWMKVNKLTREKIPTGVLYKIWKDKRFGWHWISLLDPTNEPDQLEFQPSLDMEIY